MSEGQRKKCVVAYATPERQYLWAVELSSDATIRDALEVARQLAGTAEIPWDTADVGVFGDLRSRADIPRAGDRIELYRPLAHDPKESRRDRVKRLRGSRR
jgi:uncharacterized protein